MSRIQIRRGTSTQWTASNPVLYQGELGYETDLGGLKVGNGSTAWNSLSYFPVVWSNITGKPTITSTPTAAAIALWDASKNLSANSHIDGFTTVVTSNGTTTLTAASTKTQQFTGSTDHTLVLPSTDVVAGQQYMLINNSTGSINTLASNNGVIHVLGPSVECLFTALVDTPTLPAHWEDSFYGANFAAGKVLNISSTLTLAGTDGTTFTFPSTSGTVVTLAATQGLTNKTLTTPTITNPTVTDYTESVNAVGTVTTASTLSLATGTVLTATLTASTACVFTMPSAVAGKSFVLMLKQAATTGNGTATFTNVKWGTSGAPTITATAGRMDIFSFFSDGTNWYGSVAAGYTP